MKIIFGTIKIII